MEILTMSTQRPSAGKGNKKKKTSSNLNYKDTNGQKHLRKNRHLSCVLSLILLKTKETQILLRTSDELKTRKVRGMDELTKYLILNIFIYLHSV